MNEQQWHSANKDYLLTAVHRLVTIIGGDRQAADCSQEEELSIAAGMEPQPPLATLAATFGLTPFERDVLLMCAAVELDGAFAALCSRVAGSSAAGPTFGLALGRLPGAHWSAVSSSSPLRRWRLVELRGEGQLTTTPLVIDERTLHHLVGVDSIDHRIEAATYPAERSPGLVPSHRTIAGRVHIAIAETGSNGLSPIVELCGAEAATSIEVAAAACAGQGLLVRVAPAHRLPHVGDELETFIRLWEREAALSAAALLIDCSADDPADRERDAAVERVLAEVDGVVLLATSKRGRRPTRRAQITIDVGKPTEMEQRDLWRQCIGSDDTGVEPGIRSLTAHFDLGPHAIRSACLEAVVEPGTREALAGGGADAVLARVDSAWNICRSRARADLTDLARRLEPKCTWDELVVTDSARAALEAVVRHVRHQSQVYTEWGFDARSARGRGISALFAGPSGTGKTMAAEVLATELQLDLFAIDLSAMVSKYIGETEKNLSRVFETAEASGAILLFDEADALFGRRTEVKDSHDRFANIEVSYLLQRMESYRGIAILTSNMKDALDVAFLRRISFIAEFPFPDLEMRAELWRKVFPPSTPTVDLEPMRLAQLHLAGGSIKNIALAAAFVAAAAGTGVTMAHIEQAARLEYAKSDRHITPAELKGWG